MVTRKRAVLAASGFVIVAGAVVTQPDALESRGARMAGGRPAVRALFGLDHPETSPFPSDIFTVSDATHNTGRRLDLPYPDCAIRISDCEDIDVVNTLDGFGLQPQLAIPFDGPIDVASVDSRSVFLVGLGSTTGAGDPGGRTVGITQVVWDPFTNTLYVETEELLTQHTRYALIATNRLRDTTGTRIGASEAFSRFRHSVRGAYKQALLEAVNAARRHGVEEEDLVAASVFTTQSITPIMERIRDQIKSGTPDPANFLLGPLGERAVFDRAQVTGISWRQQTGVEPPAFTTAPVNLQLLQVVPGAVGTIAYGYYVSPDYLVHPGEYIPAVGTRTGTPVVQGYNRIYFTLLLPSGAKPVGGWPVAIAGSSASGNQHLASGIVASRLASHGIATISINNPGTGFGPLTTLTINMADGSSLTIPDEGRGVDQNGDGSIGVIEGSLAASPRTWTIQERDGWRQVVADLMQLVRVIEVGVDTDGDGSRDLDPSRIYYHGVSAGAMFGTMFVALDPSVSVAIQTVAGGLTPEHARWGPMRRSAIGAMLANRIPSLINSPGVSLIDGVPTPPPHFDENKPARNDPPVVNTVVGAIEIQKAMELAEMASQSGITPVVWARHLRQHPLAGNVAKSVIFQSAEGDQNAVSSGTTAILRAGELTDAATRYRHDLAFAEDPTIPKNPHTVLIGQLHPSALLRAAARGLLDQAGVFFATGGSVVIHPEPGRLFEVPIRTPLPEELNFIR